MARPRQFDEQDVIQKATALFWEQGYRGTSPKELLEATGLSRSSLYNTFGSKQGLFERALARYVDEQEVFVGDMLDAGDLRTALTRMYDAIVGSVTGTDGPNACMVCRAALEVDPTEETLLARLASARERMQAVFTRRLVRAHEEGDIASDRDPVALARFLFHSNMGLVVLARTGAERADLEQIATLTVDAVCG